MTKRFDEIEVGDIYLGRVSVGGYMRLMQKTLDPTYSFPQIVSILFHRDEVWHPHGQLYNPAAHAYVYDYQPVTLQPFEGEGGRDV